MKLSEFKGDKAYDVLAELIEPVMTICTNQELQELRKSGAPKLKFIKPILKNNKKEITTILAVLDDKDPAEYEVNLFTLPAKILELLSDPEIEQLFTFAQ